MGRHNTDPIANLIHKFCCGKIYNQLHQKEKGRDHGYFFQGDAKAAAKGEKEKRRKVDGDGLGHIAQIAGSQRFAVIGLLVHVKQSSKHDDICI